MYRNILGIGLMFLTICSLGACGAAEQQTEVADALRSSGYEADGQGSGNREVGGESYESVEGTQTLCGKNMLNTIKV